jgi:hypothetical protein
MAITKSPLGDARLVRPFSNLVKAMAEKMTVVLRQLGQGRKDEVSFSRFLNNSKITPQALVRQYWQNNQTNWKDKHLLVVEDGSRISFQLRKDRKGMGYVGKSDRIGGFEVHCALLLDAQDLSCYGLGSAQLCTTELLSSEQKAQRRRTRWKRPFEDKDRYKWFSSAQEAVANCPGAFRYTVIGDREADIYDAMVRFEQQGWDFVIRCSADRRVSQDGEMQTLYQTIDQLPVEHQYLIDVAATANRTGHKAKVNVKFGEASLVRPKSHPDKKLPKQIKVRVVQVREDASSVVKQEEPVDWILITSHEVQSVEHALQTIRWYCERWNIEQLFRTIKLEGLDVEHSEIENQSALGNLTVLSIMAACVVIQLIRARSAQTQQNMDCVFSPKEITCIQTISPTLEGSTEKLKNPFRSDSLAFAAWVMARLGGWSGYFNKRPPGPITFVNGLCQFYPIAKGFSLKL